MDIKLNLVKSGPVIFLETSFFDAIPIKQFASRVINFEKCFTLENKENISKFL